MEAPVTRPADPYPTSYPKSHFVLLQNDGDFNFSDVAAERGAKTNVFGWGSVIADFNGDGRNDIAITENFIGMPMNMHAMFPTSGKLLMQGNDGQFYPAHKQVGVANKNFGYRAIAADLTGSGSNDLIIGNLNGQLRIFLNGGNK